MGGKAPEDPSQAPHYNPQPGAPPNNGINPDGSQESHVRAEEDPNGTSAKIAQAGTVIGSIVPGGGAVMGVGGLTRPAPTNAQGFSFGGAGLGGPGGAGGPLDVNTAVDNQTRNNRPNQRSSFGSSQWTMGPDGRPVLTTSLTGSLQQTNASLQDQARINALRGVGTGEDARNQAITGAYNQATSRLDPQWAQRDEHLASSLANQGLDPNSQAYRNAMLQQGQQRNDAYSSAMNGAIGQGTAAQQATFNENMQAQRLPYDQMGALYGLEHPFGFNAAASPNVLGQSQLNDNRTAEQRRIDADLAAAQMGALGKGIGVLGGFIKDRNGNWIPEDSGDESDQDFIDSGMTKP